MNDSDQILPQDGMKRILMERAGEVEKSLSGSLPPGSPERLLSAMRYSLDAGGKRLRPVLCISCAALCGADAKNVLPFACAIEMIHTYSLIHDDLPAMDDDDFRRGKPSCHKAFDEALAILAGDGLLTDAFALAASSPLPPENVLRAILRLAEAAGSAGMVGGQALDMEYTGRENVSLPQIRHMQSLKTGAMIEASCVCGAILAGASAERTQAVSRYGKYLGRAFQVVDDVLDITGDSATLGKPVGSDQEKGKNTCPSVLGIEESLRLAREDGEKARAALKDFSGPEAAFLLSLVTYILNRRS